MSNFSKTFLDITFKHELANRNDLFLINISTIDGFVLHQVNHKGQGIEKDKMAAISSSLCSMSNSAVKEIFNNTDAYINIESENGKILFQHVSIENEHAIITLCCKQNISLAEARFIVKRLKKSIENNAIFKKQPT